MGWRPQINERGVITRFSNSDTGEVISASEYERRMQTLQGGYTPDYSIQPGLSAAGTYAAAPFVSQPQPSGMYAYQTKNGHQVLVPPDNARSIYSPRTPQYAYTPPVNYTNVPAVTMAPAPAYNPGYNPLIQPGAQILSPSATPISAPVSAPISTPISAPVSDSMTAPANSEENEAPALIAIFPDLPCPLAQAYHLQLVNICKEKICDWKACQVT